MAAGTEGRVIPSPVLVEVDHFLGDYAGTFVALLEDIRRGAFWVENLIDADYRRIDELLHTYADLQVGFVDCAILATTERLNEPKLATLDRRHFSVMRPRHTEALRLLPS